MLHASDNRYNNTYIIFKQTQSQSNKNQSATIKKSFGIFRWYHFFCSNLCWLFRICVLLQKTMSTLKKLENWRNPEKFLSRLKIKQLFLLQEIDPMNQGSFSVMFFFPLAVIKKVAYFFFESFQIVPPVRYLCPVTEDLPSQSKSLRKNVHVLLCGANNMQPLSWRCTNGSNPLFLIS